MDLIYNIKQIGVNKLLFDFSVGTNPTFLFVMTNPWTAETKTGELPKEGSDGAWILTVTGVVEPYEDLCSGNIYFDLLGLYPVSIYKDFISEVNLIAEIGFQVVEGGIVPIVIPAPTNLVATTISDSQIDLSWTDNGAGGFAFVIERKTGVGSFAEIFQTANGVTFYADDNFGYGLFPSTEYTYRIRATDNIGNFSSYSNEASATTDSQFLFGNALRFDGQNDRVDLTSDVAVTSSASVSIWFKVQSFLSMLIANDTDTNQYIWAPDNVTIGVFLAGEAGAKNFTVPTINTDTWYHLFVTRNGTELRLYLNGVESTTGVQTVNTGTTNFRKIGSRSNGTLSWDGDLDEIGIDGSVAGTQANAIALYNSGNGSFFTDIFPTPDLYLRLNESSGNIASDDSGNNNNGTLINYANPDNGWVPH